MAGNLLPTSSQKTETIMNEFESKVNMLPEDFRVNSTGSNGTIESRILPTINRYLGEDGGYVAIYSRNPDISVYGVGGDIYVVGQIRLQGRYIGRIFHPKGYEGQDISAATTFKELADEVFPRCEGGCWAGGDTGGFLGLH